MAKSRFKQALLICSVTVVLIGLSTAEVTAWILTWGDGWME